LLKFFTLALNPLAYLFLDGTFAFSVEVATFKELMLSIKVNVAITVNTITATIFNSPHLNLSFYILEVDIGCHFVVLYLIYSVFIIADDFLTAIIWLYLAK